MATLLVGGLIFVSLDLLVIEGRDTKNRLEQEERIREIEREIQQVKDKVLQQIPS